VNTFKTPAEAIPGRETLGYLTRPGSG
jgi:hypothetical protein